MISIIFKLTDCPITFVRSPVCLRFAVWSAFALQYPFVCCRCSPYPLLQVVIPQRLQSSCSHSFEIEHSLPEVYSRQVLRFCSGRFSCIWLAHQLPLKFVPTPSKSNHPSTVRFPDAINSFIVAEISHGATSGPFLHSPFPSPLQTSPLQTVPKDDCKRRIVLDLSFPPGASVNVGILKDSFLDEAFHLSLPRSTDFADLIITKGPG